MLSLDERLNLRDNIFKILKDTKVLTLYKNGSYRISRKAKLIKALETNKELREKYDLYVEQFSCKEEAEYCFLHNDDSSNHLCPACGKVCSFYHGTTTYNEYARTCGDPKCSATISWSDENKEKRKKTNKEKYGVENPAQAKEIQDKIKQTVKNKYGVDNVFQSEEIKEKSRQTNLENLGVEYAMQSKEVQEKSKQTVKDKYGVDNVSQSEDIKLKKIETTKAHYDVENPFQSEEIKEKIKQTNLQNLGAEYAMQSKEVQTKAIETNQKVRGVNYPQQDQTVKAKSRETYILNHKINKAAITDEVNKVLAELNLNVSLQEIYANGIYFIKFIECMHKLRNKALTLKEIAFIFNYSNMTIKRKANDLHILDHFTIKHSELETQFEELLKTNNIPYTIHNHILKQDNGNFLEIDFIVKDTIGVEINDIDSHNTMAKSSDYHINKSIMAKSKNIHLIHIWEWELRDEKLWDRLSKWFINLCDDNKTRIFARSCNIKLIPIEEERPFIESYHLQGYRKSEVCYGLYYNDELIQIMSFCKSRYNQNYEWELLRLCTKYGYTVIGGSARLLKNFIKSNNPKSIISYCDLSKFTGDVYENLGFNLIKRNQPSATWYNQENEELFLHSSLVKKGADKLLGTNFGKGTNNEVIAIQSGYKKIYNCGINIYGLTFSI